MASLKIDYFANTASGYCGHCKLNVSFNAGMSTELFPTLNVHPSLSGGRDSVIQQLMQCSHCSAATVYLLEFDGTLSPSDDKRELPATVLYPAPAPRELAEEVPEKIRSLYHEGAVCEVNGALRAAAVMYRSTVEEMCKDLGAQGRDLFNRIEALAGLGLGQEVVKDMHEARFLGNYSVHDGLAFAADEVADVAELIEEALVALYVQPAQRAAFRLARKARREGTS